MSQVGINGYDAHFGVHRAGHVVVAEKVVLHNRLMENPKPAGTLYHELGHAFHDKVLGPVQRLNLAVAARADALQLPFEHHARLHAFIKERGSQPKEAFAEAFAGHMGSNSGGYEDFAQLFRRTSAFVLDIMNDPEAHHGIVYHRPSE